MKAAGLYLLSGAMLVPLLAMIPVADYGYFSTVTRDWLAGATRLYTDASFGFFYAPWALALTVPLSFLPDQLAQAVLNLLSLTAIWGATWILVRPRSPWILVPAVVHPFAGWVLLLGQWDALVLAGIGLGWHGAESRKPLCLGVGLVLASTKPTNAWLPLLLLFFACRRWPRRDLWLAGTPLLIALAASFPAAGWDWPIRFLTFVSANPPHGFDVSLWGGDFWMVQGIIAVGILFWLFRLARTGIRSTHVNLALAGNLLLSPYMVHYHMVTVGPALAQIVQRRRWVGITLWLLSFPVYWAFHTRWQVNLLLLFPLSVFLALAWSSSGGPGEGRRPSSGDLRPPLRGDGESATPRRSIEE